MTDKPKHPNIPAGAVPVEGAIFVDRATYQLGTTDDGQRMFVVHAGGATLAFPLAAIVTFAERLNRALESDWFITELVKDTLDNAPKAPEPPRERSGCGRPGCQRCYPGGR